MGQFDDIEEDEDEYGFEQADDDQTCPMDFD